jgi:hypothetical protein
VYLPCERARLCTLLRNFISFCHQCLPHSGMGFSSPKAILMAKSQMHTIYVRHEIENQVGQRTRSCEIHFAISIKGDDEPTSLTPVRNAADRVGAAGVRQRMR